MKITFLGIVVFSVLVVTFFAWFGGPPTMPDDYHMTRQGIVRSWLFCSLWFVAGAGTACFADKEYGMFPPTSLRWLFIIFGVVIMAVSTAWMYSLVKARTSDGSNDERDRVGTFAKLSPSSNNSLPALSG